MPRRKLTEEEKAARKKAKEEKLIKENLERELRDLRERHFIPEPTRYYKVGDRVQHGNVGRSVVTEVLDNGKIYKLHENVKEHNYGRPYWTERDFYVTWHDVIPYTPEKWNEAPTFRKNDKLMISYSQRDLYGLLLTHYTAGIDTDVDYQRGNVWTLEDKKRLIESIFNNIDIGKFVLIRRPFRTEGKLYEMLDGKQRLTALVEFYEGRFKYKGLKFHELSVRDQTHFEHYIINWGSITENRDKPIENKYKYEYFLKLNTFGRIVSDEHLDFVRKLYEEAS